MSRGRTGPTPDERVLVSRCLSWDPEAWEAFVAARSPFIRAEARRQLLRYLGRATPADVEDASQEVYSLLLRNGGRTLRQFRADASLSTWLSYVVRSVCRQIARAGRRPVFAAPPRDLSLTPPTEEDLPIEGLGDALAALSSRDQRILRLFFYEGRKYRDIARELGVSVNSVGPLLARALAAVRSTLGR